MAWLQEKDKGANQEELCFQNINISLNRNRDSLDGPSIKIAF
jgi:hypothetical protein